MNKFGWLFVAVGLGALAVWGTHDLWSSPSTKPRSSAREKRSSDEAAQNEMVRKPISHPQAHRPAPESELEAPPGDPEPEAEMTAEEREQAFADSLQIAFDQDVPADAESARKENALVAAFDVPKVAEAGGRLLNVSCKQSSCRGEVLFDSQESDHQVFNEVFINSSTFAEQGAISVPHREHLPDGKIRATFFIHAQMPDMATL